MKRFCRVVLPPFVGSLLISIAFGSPSVKYPVCAIPTTQDQLKIGRYVQWTRLEKGQEYPSIYIYDRETKKTVIRYTDPTTLTLIYDGFSEQIEHDLGPEGYKKFLKLLAQNISLAGGATFLASLHPAIKVTLMVVAGSMMVYWVGSELDTLHTLHAQKKYREIGNRLGKLFEDVAILSATVCTGIGVSQVLEKASFAYSGVKGSVESGNTSYESTPEVEDLIQRTKPNVPASEHVPGYLPKPWVDQTINENIRNPSWDRSDWGEGGTAVANKVRPSTQSVQPSIQTSASYPNAQPGIAASAPTMGMLTITEEDLGPQSQRGTRRSDAGNTRYQMDKMMNPGLTPTEWISASRSEEEGNGKTLIILLRTLGPNPSIRGSQFEQVAKWFILHDPKFRMLIKRVWSWKDWPGQWGPDAGIDLVAETNSGELWAIQCKAYAKQYSIQKKDIDSFLSESSRSVFSHRLLIATTDRIGPTALRTIKDQEKSVGLVMRSDLLDAPILWPKSFQAMIAPVPLAPQVVRMPHQKRAISDVVTAFEKSDRGQLHMACGTGKTLISKWIRDDMKAKTTLVAVPSLSLVHQTLREWTTNADEPFDYLVVCSDQTVVHRKTPDEISTIQMGVPVTTNPSAIHDFLATPRDRPAVVFTTYQSSKAVALAQKGIKAPFDLLIADEAHVVAGNAQSVFGVVADEKKIRANKRLFMTATPKILTENVKTRAKKNDFEVISMDDEEQFGPIFHKLTFKEALEKNLLTDYQVVVMVVTKKETHQAVKEGRLVLGPENEISDARTLGNQVALLKAMQKYDLRRVITFHSTVAKVKRFASDLADSFKGTLQMVPKSERPTGTLSVDHIEADTPVGKRAAILKGLEEQPTDSRAVVSNCACLGVGVDVPALDGIAFMDPRKSEIDIVQATGRVMRKAEDKKVGTIFIPVYLENDTGGESFLEYSEFSNVWQVLRALRAHDETLAQYLDEMRTELGKRKGPVRNKKIRMPENIIFDLPEKLQAGFANAIHLKAITVSSERPKLNFEQLKTWTENYYKRTGKYPSDTSGPVLEAPQENWRAMIDAIPLQQRGFDGSYTSYSEFLEKEFGVYRGTRKPPLQIKQIVEWARDHYVRTGEYPTQNSGNVLAAPSETWSAINMNFVEGGRGLKGYTSLPDFIRRKFNVQRRVESPDSNLDLEKIEKWAYKYFRQTGRYPTKRSGQVVGAPDEDWERIDSAFRRGTRGLDQTGFSSLAEFLKERRGVERTSQRSPLKISEIKKWVKEYKRKTGDLPTKRSGIVQGVPGENWGAIDQAFRYESRGLDGSYSSLADFLKKSTF